MLTGTSTNGNVTSLNVFTAGITSPCAFATRFLNIDQRAIGKVVRLRSYCVSCRKANKPWRLGSHS